MKNQHQVQFAKHFSCSLGSMSTIHSIRRHNKQGLQNQPKLLSRSTIYLLQLYCKQIFLQSIQRGYIASCKSLQHK